MKRRNKNIDPEVNYQGSSRKRIQKRKSIVQCTSCKYLGDTIQATAQCSICDEQLCYTCEKAHRGSKATRDHVLNPVAVTYTSPLDQLEAPLRISEGSTTEISRNSVMPQAETRPDPKIWLQCKTCLSLGRTIKATTHCAPCNKHLCHNCQQFHQGTKVTWVEGSDNDNKLSVESDQVPMQTCKEHIEEVIRYYCEDHKVFVCDLCDHARCSKTLLPDTSSNHQIPDTTESNQVPKTFQCGRIFWPISIKTEYPHQPNEPNQAPPKKRAACKEENLLQMKVISGQSIQGKPDRIHGATFLQNGCLVLCNYFSCFLHLYNQDFILKSSLSLDREPNFASRYILGLNKNVWLYDVCRTTCTQIAVTLPNQKKIQFVSTQPTLSLQHFFTVDKKCWGIDCQQDLLYIACHETPGYGEIFVMTIEGVQLKRLGKTNLGYMFICPYYVRVSGTSGRVYVSDFKNHSVTCLTQDGDFVYLYRHTDLLGPTDIHVDSEDNILVCGQRSDKVHVVDKHGVYHSTLVEKQSGLSEPRCLSYRDNDRVLFVGQNLTSKLFCLRK